MNDLIGIWIGAFLTLCIFSFLYRDNPFFRFAEAFTVVTQPAAVRSGTVRTWSVVSYQGGG